MINMRIEDGILITGFPDSTRLSLEIAKKLVAQRLSAKLDKPYPIVIHLNGVISESKVVRVFMAKEGIEGISLGAFVVKKKYEEILINMFLTIDAPKIPTRVFCNEADAITWINTLRAI